MVDPEPLLAFACGYAEDGSGGVFSYQFDPTDGSLRPLTRTKSEAAMYAGLHPSGDYIYTANRISNDVITAYRVDDTGGLKALNRQSSEGTDPSYISVDSAGEYAFVSNYTGGTVAMLPIEGDGRLRPASDVIDHEGSGPNPDRQAQPHPHSANLGPEEDFLYVPDLGTDRIAIYWIDREGGRLRPAAQPHATVQPRAGPRHLDFHPNERFCYVINELDGTIVAFEYDPEHRRARSGRDRFRRPARRGETVQDHLRGEPVYRGGQVRRRVRELVTGHRDRHRPARVLLRRRGRTGGRRRGGRALPGEEG